MQTFVEGAGSGGVGRFGIHLALNSGNRNEMALGRDVGVRI